MTVGPTLAKCYGVGGQGGASMPISGVAAAKWRTFQVRIVAAPAFSAHAAMSMSQVRPPITPRRCALLSARQVSDAVRWTTGVSRQFASSSAMASLDRKRLGAGSRVRTAYVSANE